MSGHVLHAETSSLPDNACELLLFNQPLLYFSIFGLWFFELIQTKPNFKDLNGPTTSKKFKAESNSIDKELGWI